MALNISTELFLGNFTSSAQSLERLYSNIIIAVTILLVGFVVAKLVSKLIDKILSELNLNKTLAKITKAEISFVEMISTIVYLVIIIFSVFFALKQVNLTNAVLSVTIIGAAVLILLSLIVSLIDVFPNLTSGILLHRKRLLRKGDEIVFRGTQGRISELSLLDTKIVTREDNIIIIPNSAFSKEEIKIIRTKK